MLRLVKRVLSIALIVIICLGLIGGTLWVLDYFAITNVYKTESKLPVVTMILSEIEKKKTEKQIERQEKSPPEDPYNKLKADNRKLTEEIDKLKKGSGELEKKLEIVNAEKKGLIDTQNNLQAALDSIQSSKNQAQTAKLSYEQLAKYYAEMEADAAVKIMDNLTDEVNIGILQNLEDDQVAKILSAMDPTKAANLVDKMRQ